MKIKTKQTILIGIIIFIMSTTIGFAQNKNARANIEVDGVCQMCKKRIEKAAISVKGVKSATWNVDTHELKLIYDERKTNIENISKKLASVGHDTKDIKASDEAYDGVHACCKYRDSETVKAHDNR